MGILKNKKRLILGIFIDIFICVLAFIIFFLYLSNNTIEVSSPSDSIVENTSISVPNVTDENTLFKISDIKNNVESVNISAQTRLDGYNLLYYITFDSNVSFNINDTDYSLLNDTILIIDENCTIYFKYESNGYYSDDVYEIKISNIKTSKITTEKVSEKELKEENVDKKDVEKESTSPYFIKVNYGANVVTIYTKDEDGKYTVPYKAMICSCGKYTPKNGTYKTSNKYTWRPLVHDVYGQYATRIVKKILFHSVPYSTNKKDALLYEEYDKLGTKASEGCVRLTVKDAKWIYDNCPSGTMVEFYSDSNPGPLGKPTAQKISSVEECRNWDPTDPAVENPWHTYKKEEKPSEDISNTVTNDISNNVTTDTTNNSIVDNNINNDSNNSNNTIDNSAGNSSDIANNNANNNIYNNNNNIDNSIINNTIDHNTVNNYSTFENNVVENNINNTFNNDIVNNNSYTENNVINNSTSSNDINNNSNSSSNNIDTNNTSTNTNTNNIFTNSIFNNVI